MSVIFWSFPMKQRLFSLILSAGFALALTACQSTGPLPTEQVQQIQAACNADAVIRPTANVLMTFATPAETAAVVAARAVIDPICANPANIGANAPAQLAAATGTVACVYTQVQARKEGKPGDPAACVATPAQVPVPVQVPVAAASK